jgi:hypothetical protein
LAAVALIVPLYRAEQALAQGQGRAHDHRDDPCDQLSALEGKVPGIEQRCRKGGSSSGIAKGDFNCDGIGDLAVGVPDENTGGQTNAGAVIVIYGSPTDLAAADPRVLPSQYFSQGSDGIPGDPEEDDHFGAALAAGSFNGDDCSDLAIGVPFEDIDGFDDVGAVDVIYGTPEVGLDANAPGSPAAQIWDIRDFFPCCTSAFDDDGENFGQALAWGDFDGDGAGDLAIGVPDKFVYLNGDPGGVFNASPIADNAGAVAVLYGKNGAGLTKERRQVWDQQGVHLLWRSYSQDIAGTAEFNDDFGKTLAGGDFDGNGISDLAIGIPQEDVGVVSSTGSVHVVEDAGTVQILYGKSGDGLTNSKSMSFSHASLARSGRSGDSIEEDAEFGSALAAGNFDGLNGVDLAVGAPDKNVFGWVNAGAVSVIYSAGTSGLATAGNQFFPQNDLQMGSRNDDALGQALAAGDFNGDGRADLAIGVPGADVRTVRNGSSITVNDAGAVFVVYSGGSSGLSPTNMQYWHQDVANAEGTVEGTAETGDAFGSALTAWNFGNESPADLAIGVPFENVGSIADAGAVNVLYGSRPLGHLTGAGDQIFTEASSGMPSGAEANDHFGKALY